MGRQLAAVVDGLLEPLVEDRLTAADALEILSDDSQPQSNSAAVERNRQAHTRFIASVHCTFPGCLRLLCKLQSSPGVVQDGASGRPACALNARRLPVIW